MDLAELMRKRRMVHRFERRSPPRELIDKVLETALHAPSGGFSQGFAMVVIDDPARVRWFHETTAPSVLPPDLPNVIETGPPVLAIALASSAVYTDRYSQPDKQFAGLQLAENWPVPYWWVDAGMAVMLVLLAAVEHGLGGWFFGMQQGEEQVRRELRLPDGYAIVGVIGLGYKAADDRKLGSSVTIPRRRFEDVVRRDNS